VTSVSNAGKKRGRAKGLVRRKDLNRGQVIGIGKANIQWPGLSAPIIRGRELVQREHLPPDPEREAKLIKIRDSMSNFKFQKLTPLERGWSGAKMPGRSIGPPDAIGEDSFEGFDTKVLELKTVINMKGNLGRKRRLAVAVITGNGNGLAGFATAKAVDSRTALRKAKNRAGQKLMHFELSDGHTVFHDFFCQFGKTKLIVQRKPEGYGLVCHRAVKTICEVVGIKNIYAKLEGSNTVQHIMKAFLMGLLKQKPFEQLSESKGLHLVAFKKECGDFPQVVASPNKCRTEDEIRHDEVMDYTQFAMDGRVVLKRKKFPPFYHNYYSYQLYLKKLEKYKNHHKTRLELIAEHGKIKSFYSDKHPEASPSYGWFLKKQKNTENDS